MKSMDDCRCCILDREGGSFTFLSWLFSGLWARPHFQGGGRNTKCIVALDTSHLFLIKEAAE